MVGVLLIKYCPLLTNFCLTGAGCIWFCITANNPSEICLQMREKGYASRIVVQRSTEEESLHVIKFWRDFDSQPVGTEMGIVNKIVPARVIESLLSQVPGLSFWRYGNSNSRWYTKRLICVSVILKCQES
ncbi:uncharacterized protein LOC114271860 [Camellia sinensis]|uniref:uncharacterized protein LOC114271860 n=1 Tax=Camellia sinensis TaxID=4442 RepID=UPI001036DA59|nr:uncharacterized protein LOC114271860 [Camellia sinensis]